MRPETDEHAAAPNPGEALGVWMLGVLWVLICLWLGHLASAWVLGAALAAGLLALWGWRHAEWLWWFPCGLVAVILLEPVGPLPLRGHYGPLGYSDLLAACVILVAVVRAAGLRRRLLPKTALDGPLLAVLALFAVHLTTSPAIDRAFLDFKRFVTAATAFYATTAIASRPRGSRWVWAAFPAASALAGLLALGALAPAVFRPAVDPGAAARIWAGHGALGILIVALPVSLGLALDGRHGGARAAWVLAAVVGAAGLALGPEIAADGAARPSPLEFWKSLISCAALTVFARWAWVVRRGRPHESPRWAALALAFFASALLEWIAPVVAGPAVILMAVAAGLTTGTARADARAGRVRLGAGSPARKAA